MRRSILTSFVLIGAVLALVVGASTFAVFTDDTTGTLSIEAGTVDVLMAGQANDDVEFETEFTSSTCDDIPAAGMLPGASCNVVFDLVNAGTLSATWDITVTETDTLDCYTVVFSPTVAALEAGDEADLDHDAGETAHAVTMTITLDDDNACQGATLAITFYVLATQSGTPYD